MTRYSLCVSPRYIVTRNDDFQRVENLQVPLQHPFDVKDSIENALFQLYPENLTVATMNGCDHDVYEITFDVSDIDTCEEISQFYPLLSKELATIYHLLEQRFDTGSDGWQWAYCTADSQPIGTNDECVMVFQVIEHECVELGSFKNMSIK